MRLTIRKICVAVFVLNIFVLDNIQAQGIMKDPVSFKLKNGITVVVAENSGLGKIYASVKIEDTSSPYEQDSINKKGLSVLLGNIFNETAMNKTRIVFENSGKESRPKVSLTAEEGNIASSVEDFENAFYAISSALQHPELDQTVLDKISINEIKNSSLAEVSAFYHQQVVPSKVSITMVGDLTLSEAKSLAKKTFGDWKGNKEASLAR